MVPSKKKLSQKDVDRVTTLWKLGYSAEQIGQKVGCTPGIASKHRPLSVKVAARKRQAERLFRNLEKDIPSRPIAG
jgi:hypothetical protein